MQSAFHSEKVSSSMKFASKSADGNRPCGEYVACVAKKTPTGKTVAWIGFGD